MDLQEAQLKFGLDKLLTRSDVLKHLRVTRQTLDAWIKNGKFPSPIALGERSMRWRMPDIIAWEFKQAEAYCRKRGIKPAGPAGRRARMDKAMTANEHRAEADRLDAIEAAEKEKVSA